MFGEIDVEPSKRLKIRILLIYLIIWQIKITVNAENVKWDGTLLHLINYSAGKKKISDKTETG